MVEIFLVLLAIFFVALYLRKRDIARLNQLESEVLLKTSAMEKKLADLEHRLKIAEGIRRATESVSIPTPAAPVEALPFVAQLVTPVPTIPAAKPAAIENFVEKRIAEKAEKVAISTPTPSEPTPLPAAMEGFGEKPGTEKVEKAAILTPKPFHELLKAKAPISHTPPTSTSAAYAWDEDHDLKQPSSLTKEQPHLDYLELLLGRKVLGWVAAIAMILSAVFLINYTAQRFTMPPIFRVISLFALSLGMIGFGYRYFLIGWKRFSRMLTTTGIIIAFLAGYATYGYYQLLPGTAAFLLMSVVVIGSFLLAYGYRSILIGVHAIIGGLAVPLLVESSGETYPQFFAYLFLLNLGTVLLLNTLNRLPIGLLAMLGTQIEFFFWYLSVGTVHWDGREFLFSLDDQVAVRYAFAFQAAFYLLYLIDTSFGTISTRFRTTWDDTVRAILAPMIGFGWIYVLYHQNPVMGGYMGLFAFIGAAWYALVHQLYVGFTKKKLKL